MSKYTPIFRTAYLEGQPPRQHGLLTAGFIVTVYLHKLTESPSNNGTSQHEGLGRREAGLRGSFVHAGLESAVGPVLGVSLSHLWPLSAPLAASNAMGWHGNINLRGH